MTTIARISSPTGTAGVVIGRTGTDVAQEIGYYRAPVAISATSQAPARDDAETAAIEADEDLVQTIRRRLRNTSAPTIDAAAFFALIEKTAPAQ